MGTHTRLEKLLNFSTDEILRNQYVDTNGFLRLGLVLEDVDLLCGNTAMRYLETLGEDKTKVVTVSIDRLDLMKQIPGDKDLHFVSTVNGVGKYSMETGIELFSGEEDNLEKVLSGYLYFVGLTNDLKEKKSLPKLHNPDSKILEPALARMVAIKERIKHKPFQEQLTSEEQDHMARLILTYQESPEQFTRIEDTTITNTHQMFPQDKNIHNIVFGGRVVRLAYESAWQTAMPYVETAPLPVCVDRVDFNKPLSLGDIVKFTSMVTHIGETSLNVQVEIDKLDPSTRKSIYTTNICRFTFVSVNNQLEPQTVPKKIFPSETMNLMDYFISRRNYFETKERLSH
jgi:acyl-coenzyme A thioesterase 9